MTRLAYLIQEALINMRRNLLVVTGAVLAVFVSLALALGALMVNEIVRVNTLQWQEGTHVIVFLKDTRDGISLDSQLALREQIDGWDVVSSTQYVDQQAAYEEFKELFANTSIVRQVDPSVLPASIRIRLTDITQYRDVTFRLIDEPAVREVVSPGESIDRLSNLSSVLNWLGLGLALIQGAAAVVLISNTIRMAIYARREEVAVMRLVGASNWFIRIPFLIEGMLEGFAGAAVAVFAVWFARRRLGGVDDSIDLFQLTVADGFFLKWALLFLLFGAVAGILGSALGLRRFLKV
ncbi:MAG: ABC transporter permease [Acidimicrobiia bacterium]|nr:ABC transporter permease [Acidimicrobiia bacterium]